MGLINLVFFYQIHLYNLFLETGSEHKKEDVLFSEEPEDKGDEFMAVKPWLGAIKEPTGYKMPAGQNKAPNVKIELNYVFGYRAKCSFFFYNFTNTFFNI